MPIYRIKNGETKKKYTTTITLDVPFDYTDDDVEKKNFFAKTAKNVCFNFKLVQ